MNRCLVQVRDLIEIIHIEPVNRTRLIAAFNTIDDDEPVCFHDDMKQLETVGSTFNNLEIIWKGEPLKVGGDVNAYTFIPQEHISHSQDNRFTVGLRLLHLHFRAPGLCSLGFNAEEHCQEGLEVLEQDEVHVEQYREHEEPHHQVMNGVDHGKSTE